MSTSVYSKNFEIEALRSIAVFMPVLGHLGNLLFWYPQIGNWSYGLWAGVDIFFCISGYVITNAFYKIFYSAARHQDKTNFIKELVSFYMRRAYRILPSAWLWIVFVCVCSVVFNSTGIFGSLKGNIFDGISIGLFASNLHFASCYASILGDKLCGNNGIYWSVSLEEQFYFLFPFLFFLRVRWVFWLSIAILLGTCVLYLTVPTKVYVLYTRIDGIMLGVCLAIFRNTKAYSLIEPKFLASGILRWLSAPLLIGAILVVPSGGGVIPFSFTAVTLLCTITVWLASYNSGYLFCQGMFRRALAYIGARSFAIYLIHNPVFWVVRESWARIKGPDFAFGPHYTIKFCVTAIVLIVVLAELNYRLVETPLRKRGIEKAKKYLTGKSDIHALAYAK